MGGVVSAAPRGWAEKEARDERVRKGRGPMMDGRPLIGGSEPRALRQVSLADRYDVDAETVLLSGVQALLRATIAQAVRDRLAGLRTHGYVTGYRGSPLGAVDLTARSAGRALADAGVRFEPGLNEDTAATAIWGAQQAELRGQGTGDGVFSLWYGKGPGVDRSGDVFRHANLAGASARGGVVVAMGDDHTCESSTTCHQSDLMLMGLNMPVLHPAGPQEVLDFSLIGWGLSRFTGCWVGLKSMKDTVEATAVVDGSIARVMLREPEVATPPEGLNILLGESPQAQEARLIDWRLPAVGPYARANGLDRRTLGRAGARIGVLTSGKSWLDVMEAMRLLGLGEAEAERLGLSVWKAGLAWPLETEGLRGFADGLDLLIVVEEKRAYLEPQAKEALYGLANAPRIVGKTDESGATLLRSTLDLDPVRIAAALGRAILAEVGGEAESALIKKLKKATEALEMRQDGAQALSAIPDLVARTPYFCAGCPHNRSTKTPEGQRAYAGIGCHYMAQWMDRNTTGFTHMGGEGAQWIGEAPFSREDHVFQNMGDGTFNHSGLMAVRAAVASGVSITFKILFNDAVAMTGGQKNDGGLTPQKTAAELLAAGVGRVEVVGEPSELRRLRGWPSGVRVRPREDFEEVQLELSRLEGATALLFVQTCAAEKRRRRRKGTFPKAEARVFINPEVCEGCGDCGLVSNCVAIQPLQTPLGLKRRIDQSACNQDFTCVEALCPSFVAVEGGAPRKPERVAAVAPPPEPVVPDLAPGEAWRAVFCGVGGTGVVTSGALLAMAAHLEGKGAEMLEMAGLAQKGGAVQVHLRLTGEGAESLGSARTPPGEADLLLGGDLAVAASSKTLTSLRDGRARAAVDLAETPPVEFTRDGSARLPGEALKRTITARLAPGGLTLVRAVELAESRLGDRMLGNSVLIGAAWQSGLLPLSREAIQEAMRLNGVSVEDNLAAFELGRAAAADPEAFAPRGPEAPVETLQQTVEGFAARLERYQDRLWADRYRDAIEAVVHAEASLRPGEESLSLAAARSLYKLMSYKDEYEVARLHAETSRRLAEEIFEPEAESGRRGLRVSFRLSPPLLTRPGPDGRPRKMKFGSAFLLLRHAKALRGTPVDPFGWTEERRLERALIARFEKDLRLIARTLTAGSHALAVEIAEVPMAIKGFGAVKLRAAETAGRRRAALVERFLRRDPARRNTS